MNRYGEENEKKNKTNYWNTSGIKIKIILDGEIVTNL